jgi:hypothetical protein
MPVYLHDDNKQLCMVWARYKTFICMPDKYKKNFTFLGEVCHVHILFIVFRYL